MKKIGKIQNIILSMESSFYKDDVISQESFNETILTLEDGLTIFNIFKRYIPNQIQRAGVVCVLEDNGETSVQILFDKISGGQPLNLPFDHEELNIKEQDVDKLLTSIKKLIEPHQKKSNFQTLVLEYKISSDKAISFKTIYH